MSVFFLLLVVMVSYVVVRIGAIALELTGTPWEAAKFQALSAFSTCGFTTAETEEVVNHPLRRRIVSYLIILGNAGLVGAIGTLAGALIGSNVKETARDFGIIAASILIAGWIFRRRSIADRARNIAKRWLARRYNFTPNAEALLHFDEGYCLTRMTIAKRSPVAGQVLRQLDLKRNMVQILAIERDGQFLPIPDGNAVLKVGDHVTIYATRSTVDTVFEPDDAEPLSVVFTHGRGASAQRERS